MQALDEGEAEVIVLADELKADLVIIDERLARQYIGKAKLNLIGTLGIIANAKQAGLISEAKSLIEEMLNKGRWFNKTLINSVLTELGEDIL